MEFLGWLWWGIVKVLGIAWGIIWFLLGGWVSTIAQIGVLVGIVMVMKFGWRRAPQEVLGRAMTFGRFFWGWVRARDMSAGAGGATRETVRIMRFKERGDVNLSTLLTLLMVAGLSVLAVI